VKAAIRERYGRPEDVVELLEIDRPTPVDDQLLVRVRGWRHGQGDHHDGLTWRDARAA
jgi:NADPH:quinone reductase-like Zn-dependent oxidoreductase